jgi:hypothetical protein
MRFPWLHLRSGKKLAVIENEFGEVGMWAIWSNACCVPMLGSGPQVGIDDALVSRRLSADEEILEMNNGAWRSYELASLADRLPSSPQDASVARSVATLSAS